jgi:hypothetical protein
MDTLQLLPPASSPAPKYSSYKPPTPLTYDTVTELDIKAIPIHEDLKAACPRAMKHLAVALWQRKQRLDKNPRLLDVPAAARGVRSFNRLKHSLLISLMWL